jgi:poly-gamma-glutamate capsule biosynthesis protein CapA/YwtB (metallophosphatase superfamily)
MVNEPGQSAHATPDPDPVGFADWDPDTGNLAMPPAPDSPDVHPVPGRVAEPALTADPPPAEPPPAGPPPAEPPSRRHPLAQTARRHPVLTAVAAAAAVLALLLAAGGVLNALNVFGGNGSDLEPLGQWQPAVTPTPGEASPSPAPEPEAISLSATGDIILGDAGSLPPADGAGFFDGVADSLAADLIMGNLEQPLTGDTGFRKCTEDSDGCHAFRAPPRYAAHLREAGFDLLNLANNHGNDFGPDGHANTQAALDEQDIAHTGDRDQITVVEVGAGRGGGRGISVAVVGFSAYAWTNDLNDLDQASGVVTEAAGQADLVVVQVHMGAEGSDATHVRPGSETFFGENRGDPIAFSHAVIDAGADLVVGHGPHVLRGLEFHRGRLIAYSLGNFAGGGGTLGTDGPLGLGAVLRVSLQADGSFAGGELVSTHMYQAGLPNTDPEQRSLALVRDLTGQDFPDTGAQLGPDGEITEP